ncbi:cytochrome C [Caenimonas koreensis]|uniref:cytochrome C n=1 Tax=Caenimonas koreensis TaxID=367474 RepID=UPI003784F8DA
MHFRHRFPFAAALWLAAFLFCAPAVHAQAQAAPPSLDNATCLSCHDGKKSKLEVAGVAGKPRALHPVEPDKFSKSVHAKMQCVACHTDITDNADKANAHAKATSAPLKKVDCASCHQDLWDQAQKQGKAAERPGLAAVAKNVQAYGKSFHARPNADDKTKANATCDNCHDTHSFNVPARTSPEYQQWRMSISQTCGTDCHTDQLDAYKDSVHGKANDKNKDAKAAVCTDCHSAHSVANTTGDPFKLAISSNCGSCHKEQLDSYKATYHGSITTLGYSYTAKCYNCHGSHEILKVNDPKSTVHPDNRMKTCASCHNPKKGLADPPPGFASFLPHGHAHNFARYPQIWIAFQMMAGLLVGTFGFFWLHTALWFYREYQDRKAHGGDRRVRLDEVPVELRGKHIMRFSPIWRIAHLLFALSLMVLTLTGMPLFYPDVPWASTVMHLLGGPKVAGLIHRTSAVIFAGVFFWHLLYVALRIARNWKTFRFFGPDSLIPNLQDLWDIVAMFKWFFGKGPRPVFDRWTYWEKFDYWAPFWGVTIIGVSGLVMWLPGFFGAFLPGWVFNVAAIFHGEEAFLAVVFLFTVHFFNNHFRPDKFPVEVAMFTGTLSLEHFRREHALEYERLVASGELQGRLVDAPSAAKVTASKALAFVLIVVGLTLLTLVGVGFFSGM